MTVMIFFLHLPEGGHRFANGRVRRTNDVVCEPTSVDASSCLLPAWLDAWACNPPCNQCLSVDDGLMAAAAVLASLTDYVTQMQR
jgi:hypothetical protein